MSEHLKISVDHLQERYDPFMALILYKNTSNHLNDYNTYIESHGFLYHKNKFILGPGSPLKESTLTALKEFLAKDSSQTNRNLSFKSIIPKNVLYADNTENDYVLIWHKKPGREHLYFSEGLNIKNGNYPTPGLIFKATQSELSCYAVTDDPVTIDTQLYYAPYTNIYQSGSVCLGSIKTPKNLKTFDDAIITWERLFFGSYFSHLAENNSNIRGNLFALFQTLYEGSEPFPNEVLLPTPKKLKQLLP